MLTFKVLGMLLIVSACSMIGFLKGQTLKNRCKKLSLFCGGLNVFYEYIQQGGCELDKAIKSSFDKCDFIYSSNGDTFCYDNDLSPADKAIIDEFFMSLGRSAKKSECDRIRLCEINMQKRLAEAENEKAQKCKIYGTFGVCIGLAIAVLLI